MDGQGSENAAAPTAVGALVQTGRIEEAAARCAAAGDHSGASRLYEQACAFGAAADHALLDGDFARSMQLAILAGDEAQRMRIRTRICEDAGLAEARRVAAAIADRGHDAEAALLWAATGEPLAAAEAFERAALPLEAGRAYDEAGRPADAARVLEAALRPAIGATDAAAGPPHDAAGPPHDAAGPPHDDLRLALGQLYASHGRDEAAVRVLQRIAESSSRRRDALALLATCLHQLGLEQARSDVHAELARLPPLAAPSHEAARTLSAAGAPASNGARTREQGAAARLFGRYAVEREVVTTPHARLLEAIDDLTGERVAVKLFAAQRAGAGRDAWHRFAREAEALRQLRHPNVVEMREFVPAGPALVMPWMAGGSLRDLIDREPLSPARAAEIASAMLSALGEAHRRGIVHRDVKPSNVLFDESGTPRLADFGAAHLDASGATVTAAEIGTAAYMSPEQRRGEPATARSDLFGVGMLLLEMIHGSLPTGAICPSEWHPDLGEPHDELVAALVAAAPANRFPDAPTALQRLRALHWSDRRMARRHRPTPARAPAHRAPAASRERLGPAQASPDGWPQGLIGRDEWIDRDVLVLDDDAVTRDAARAFARADHPALPTVLRIDGDAHAIWIAMPLGVPLAATGRRLDVNETAALRHALTTLAAAGGHHGAVDAHHVFIGDGAATLAWPGRRSPSAPHSTDVDTDDLAGLQRLAGD